MARATPKDWRKYYKARGARKAVNKLIATFNAKKTGNTVYGESGNVKLDGYQTVGDYNDDNNPALVKWQGQEEGKSARFLAKVDNDTDLSQIQNDTGDPWAFYDNPAQKFVLQMGLNKKSTVLSEADFNRYVNQTGATVIYRGISGNNAFDRYFDSPNSHIGTGINGDGYYWTSDKSVAQGYGGTGLYGALSPSARVISADAVRAEIARQGSQFQRSLQIAGSTGSRSYGDNVGEMQMALKMGYNVIDAGWAIIPITRDAVITVRKKAWG